ncbi:Dimethylaniline monooxygenase [N-oxide-forming] 5, partial [Sciurus carolinensis]|nr:Dimethylaniline monooxygenase [N-oxide-forming] 5 [Sciurus carolinensis]
LTSFPLLSAPSSSCRQGIRDPLAIFCLSQDGLQVYLTYVSPLRRQQFIQAKLDPLCMLLCFQTTVYSAKKRPDFSTSGQWEVVTECNGKKEVNVFDGVMLCTVHHPNAHLPLESFPGIEKFKGQYFHSRDYKNPEALAEKRVFIIIGNSGGDLAVEISYTVKQAELQGCWTTQVFKGK